MVSPVTKMPGCRLEVKVTPGQLSVAVGGGQFSVAVHESASKTTKIGSVGQLASTGAVAYVTVTLKVQVAELPKSSVAV